MESYGEILFTPAVRSEQDKVGMGARFEQMYASRHRGPIDADTRTFMETRSSMYMASNSASGWPYVQHRGGPPGFIKVLADTQIGFADYPGNKQFISKGNLETDDRVSLFMMDYPRRARLKILGRARMTEAESDPAFAETLAIDGQAPAERLCVIDVVALDWNCPKYILPRFSETEIEQMLGPRLATLAKENAALKAHIAELEGKGGDR